MTDIVLISPRFEPSFFGFQYALPILGAKSSSPPAALPLLAALTPADFTVTILDEEIAPIDFERCARADIVGVTGMIVQRQRMKEVLTELKLRECFTVVGGPWITAQEDYFGNLADVIFIGEAEESWPLFLSEWSQSNHARRYQQKNFTDMTTVPAPRYDLIDRNAYALASLQISRGCPFLCDFCDIIVMFGRKPRLKTAAQVIAELDMLLSYGKTQVFIVDDNLIGAKAAIKPILREIVAWQQANGYRMDMATEASLDLADDAELMQLFAEANICKVFIGVESPNEAALRETRKHQNLRNATGSIVDKVHRVQSYGIEVWTGMILGFDADDTTIFAAQTQFVQQARVTLSLVGSLTAVPTTPLHKRLAAEGRLDLSDTPAFGTNVIPAQMTREQLWDGYVYVMSQIYEPATFMERVDALYDSFGGAFQKARSAHLRANSLYALLWRARIVVEASVLTARLLYNVSDQGLRRLYLQRIMKMIRERRPLPMIHDFIAHCVMHYHAWRLAADLRAGAMYGSL